MSTDIVYCSLPPMFIDRVPGAPPILKSVTKEAGYTAVGVDFNISIFIKQCARDVDKFMSFIKVFHTSEQDSNILDETLNEWAADCITTLKSHNPKIVGISVFSFLQQLAAEKLANTIRRDMPNVKILMGGLGIEYNNISKLNSKAKKLDHLKPFHQYMLEQKLVDHVIHGNDFDGLINYLSEVCGASDKLIKFNTEGITFNTPVPDYDDYNFDDYVFNGDKTLPVTGSRGCVRNCTFCDVHSFFGKFSFRTGEHIAEEMIALSNRYNIRTFEFTDSLVNGSFKSFKDWLSVLAAYNDSAAPDKKIRWFGQYITRPQAQTPKGIYELIKKSGAANLVIGMESGSDEVLEAMKKQITVKDIYDELDQFEKHGISMHMLMFSGFYNETWERYLKTLEFLVNIRKYVANGVIAKISIGPPLFINDLVPLGAKAEEHGIEMDPHNYFNWTTKDDPSNTMLERIRRRLITQELLDKMGIATSGNSIATIHRLGINLDYIENQLTNELIRTTNT